MGMRATAVVCLLLLVTGCASAGGDPAARTAARFLSAAAQGRGQQACDLLTPRAAESVDDCATEILSMGLRAGAVGDTQVYGDEAQVRVGGDTVFLHRFPGGWRVRAAGCRPRSGQPYECEVEA
ncbi:hypothetical protein GCM10009530_69430 [Microbispora corallina]|uniref:Lipoprotein n=1 Tax=Microbispora corallina TaxID=83302 RepID=A0ABQ4G348_9ACTN|nr:hypothetical protein [Microbispora corallina]GIH41494.1 hypothetical protein Mco01_44940 [Microbispora corallina]